MTDSQKLLADYVRTGSESAFREVVQRYLDLVYSAALRLVESDTHRAQDVAQTVFVDLARLAQTLSPNVKIGGWLHRHTCFVAANTMRGERRRRAREKEAVEMTALQDNVDFTSLAPVLDEAINELDDEDRTAILLRFFEQNDFRSVGKVLGSSEDAARMRVNRALEKLQSLLIRRGVTTSAAVLSTVLLANAVQAAPVGLAATVCTATLAGTALTTTATATATKAIAMTALQKTFITASLAVLAGTGIYEAHRAAQLRAQNQTLQQQSSSLSEQVQQLQQERDDALKRYRVLSTQPAPRLPAPPIQVAAPPAEEAPTTNLYARMKNTPPRLTSEQVESYLKANGRGAATLLAAFRTSGDPALLKEAMEKYPNDPQVAFEAVFSKQLSPAQQRQWLETFKKSAPDNALANYLSALNYFNSGQIDEGVKELSAASGKQLYDYTLRRVQDDEEAYLGAGYSLVDAKAVATSQLLLPQLKPLKQLSLDMMDLANAYRQAGDESSAQGVLQMAATLGGRYSDSTPGEAEVSQLVGMYIEHHALEAMNPNSPYGDSGQTVQQRFDQLTQAHTALTTLSQQAAPLLPTLSDQDWMMYKDRWIMFGEENALRWVVGKYGQK